MGQVNSQTFPQRREGHYQYGPLKKKDREIRLLALLPSTDKDSDIYCNIGTVPLTCAPSYEALSYTWGAPGDNCPNPIFLDGYPTTVSRNLESALRVLRHDATPRGLWVDAICINQASNIEKSFQSPSHVNIRRHQLRTRPSADLRCRERSDWESLQPSVVLSRWVIQEFTLGHDPYFLCGLHSFQWARIEEVLGGIIGSGSGQPQVQRESKRPHFEVLDKLERSDIWMRLIMERRRILIPRFGKYGESWPFLALLNAHIGLNATQGHDKIYALLGLAQKYRVDIPGKSGVRFDQPFSLAMRDGYLNGVEMFAKAIRVYSPSIPPTIDYDRPIHEVYIEWARWIIEKERSLDILFTSQKTLSEYGLPSWVPNWQARLEDEYVPNFSECLLTFSANGHRLLRSDVPASPAEYSFSADNRQLSVVGRLLVVLDETFRFTDIEADYERRLFPFLPPTYISGQYESVWKEGFSFYKHFTATNNSASPFGIAIDLPLSLWRIPRDYAAKRRQTPSRVSKLRDVITMNRKQFTGAGGWSGLVPKETQHGDVICVIGGVQTPFVLRPERGIYKIVGECFVEGCMEGKKTARPKSAARTFIIE